MAGLKMFATRLRCAVILAAAALLLTSQSASADSHGSSELPEQVRRLAEIREQLESVAERVADNAELLEQARTQLATVLDAVRAADEAVQRSAGAVASARERLTAARREEQEQLRIAGARAVERYKEGGGLSFAALLSADDALEAVERSAYLNAVGQTDVHTTEALTAARMRVESDGLALEAEQAVQRRVLDEQRLILAEIEALRDERTLILAADQAELDRLQAQELHLEADTRSLEMLSREPAQLPSIATPPANGGWAWPVEGSVTSEYGNRWGRLHAGIDIAAPTGTPVRAALDGCVSFAARQGGYGNLILIDHGGGIVTAYAHQSRLLASRGACVTVGQQIGEVGSTGNSTGPHLHFEVRVDGTASNPRRYLP